MKETLTQSSGSLSFLLHQTSYIILMQLVVPNAVRNAVSAATTIFTANSIHRFFSMIIFIFSFFILSFSKGCARRREPYEPVSKPPLPPLSPPPELPPVFSPVLVFSPPSFSGSSTVPSSLEVTRFTSSPLRS